jgi:hypothetical protein
MIRSSVCKNRYLMFKGKTGYPINHANVWGESISGQLYILLLLKGHKEWSLN